MKITVIHPSRGRVTMADRTISKWLAYADGDIEYILSLDNDDAYWYLPLLQKYYGKITHIINHNKTAIEAINEAAKIATGDLFVVVSDDFICPNHWDTKLQGQLEVYSDFCAKTRDGLQPTLITLPIMDRLYYNRYGYIYNPAYSHMFVDQEMTAVAIMTGRYISLDITFEHLHYSSGKTKKDAINDRNNATWQQGERLFNERLKTNFGIENPVIPYSEIKWR
jgi:glycosyltransferase involved in cell wall biosynthesis